MAKKFLNANSKYKDIKENESVLSALKEVVKTNGIEFEPKDDMSLEEIAKILKVDLNDFLLIVNEKNGTGEEFKKAYPVMNLKSKSSARPEWLKENEILDLDVRESLSNGIDPFGMIMKTIAGLNGKVLHIINTFETAPLYAVLGKQGFEYYAEEENGIWHIYFYKK